MSAATHAAPLVLSPSWSFGGNDGNFSTFTVEIGTGTPQSFSTLPSTSGSETWVPLPEGCQGIMVNVSNCGELRGVHNVNNTASRGFQTNASSTWDAIGIYELSTDQNLFGTSNDGLYGQDTVAFDVLAGIGGSLHSVQQSIPLMTVAGIASANFWLGSLGLGTALGNFTVESENILSVLDNLHNQTEIPSLSFGYAAGASYHSPPDYGSLVLGGYDQSRFTPTNMSMPLGGASNTTLGLKVKSIVAQNVFGGTLSLLANGSSITTVIDSTITQLWLPQAVCDLFAQAFGLIFDPITDLYLVNDTIHSQLLEMNPSITFTVGANSTSDESTNIVFPYAAFDLGASIPIYNESTPYFPIRVAANESQYTLGRAFLQEAYLSVDWERQNFTLAQVLHQNDTTNIIPRLSPVTTTPHKSMKIGVTAGIAVGACAVLAIILGLLYLFVSRIRRKQRATTVVDSEQAAAFLPDQKVGPYESVSELHGDQSIGSEIMSQQIYEMQDSKNRQEIMSTPLTELPGHSVGQELDGDSISKEKESEHKAAVTAIYELP